MWAYVGVTAEERDGEARGRVRVFSPFILYVGDLSHWRVKSESTFGALVSKHKGAVPLKSKHAKTGWLLNQTYAPNIDYSCLLQGWKYVSRFSLSSSLLAKLLTFALLSFRKTGLMYCTALQNWEVVISHHRNNDLLKWVGHWMNLRFPRPGHCYFG